MTDRQWIPRSQLRPLAGPLTLASSSPLLQQVVRIRSYSADDEEGTIARFMRDRLAALGLEVELQEVQPNRFNYISLAD